MKRNIFTFAMVVAACVSGATAWAQPEASLLKDMAGYYQFEGSGADASGNGRDLTLVGQPDFAPGLFGQALDLHRDPSQYAERLADDAEFNFDRHDFTLQTWIYLYSYNLEQTFIEKFDGQCGPGWTLTTPTWPSPFLQFYANHAGIKMNTPGEISTRVWHQIIVRRTDETINVFFDGVIINSTKSRDPISHTRNGLLIGKRNANDGRDFSMNGRIDEIGIWSRALTTDEVKRLYNDGHGLSLETTHAPSPLAVNELKNRLNAKPAVAEATITSIPSVTLQIQSVPNQPKQMSLSFGPVAGSLEDNKYQVLYSTNPINSIWWPLSNVIQSRVGQQQTVIDTDAGEGSKFYRVIVLP